KELLLPAAPFRLLGKLVLAAQAIEKKRVLWPALQEGGIEAPELLKGLIVEFELLVGVEDGDGRGELVQRIGVAAQCTFIFPPQRLDLTPVDGNAGAAVCLRVVGNGEDTAVTLHARGKGIAEDRLVEMMPLQRGAGSRRQELAAFACGGLGAFSLHRARVGRVDPFQLAPFVAQPE